MQPVTVILILGAVALIAIVAVIYAYANGPLIPGEREEDDPGF